MRLWYLIKICYPHLRTLLLWVIVVAALVACSGIKYVSVPEYHYVNTNSIDTIRDSIYHDVFHSVYVKGDTVYDVQKEKVYVDRFRYIYKDSIINDSIPIPYPIERNLTKWERLCIDWFGYLVSLTLIVLALLVIVVLYLIKKKVWKIGAMLP